MKPMKPNKAIVGYYVMIQIISNSHLHRGCHQFGCQQILPKSTVHFISRTDEQLFISFS